MRCISLVALLVAVVFAQEVPPPPVPESACVLTGDLQFVLDSSSSIGEENFALIKDFVYEVVSNLDVGKDGVHVGMSRYNSWVDHRFFMNTFTDKDAVLEEIQNCPYYGRGTKTAQALSEVASHSLQPYNGWRGHPTAVVVITDGRSQDAAGLAAAAKAVKAKATRVIAIGIGPNVVGDELVTIASQPSDTNVYMTPSFEELSGVVGEILEKVCEIEDDVNECAVGNGGCQVECVNTLGAYYCDCPAGYVLSGSTECQDVDECLVENGGCEGGCENSIGSYTCTCPEGLVLGSDGLSCVEDSCFGNNACAHSCKNVEGGEFVCVCDAGYELAEDLVSCVDIDECLEGTSGCQHGCNNTVGGFACSCPDGQGLRDDGLTCGTICYTCENVLSNDECNEAVICSDLETACQTKTRLVDGLLYITKRCKQPEACSNNQIQNPRAAVDIKQCQLEGEVSVCRCCCFESYCNSAGDCEEADNGVRCPSTDTLVPPNGGSLECSGNAIGDSCAIVCPAGYAPANGNDQVFCNLKPRSLEGVWVGEISPCVDINECLDNNGGCSHDCVNLNGTYECRCPNENPCQFQVFDLLFIVDSSSSIGEANWATMVNWLNTAASLFTIGQDFTRIAMVTYNNNQVARMFFNEVESIEQFQEKVDAIVYEGRGTRTASAIRFSAAEMLSAAAGRRAFAPLATVVITDGRASDKRFMDESLAQLVAAGSVNFAIGVSENSNEKELLKIAGGVSARYRQVDNFDALTEELLSDMSICIGAEDQHYMTSDGKTCDVDECAYDNGGCSDDCANTIGSYVCLCPPGEEIVNDGKTCDQNECAVGNGGCSGDCVNTLGGFHCLCDNEFQVDGVDCVDYNECADDNGGCSHDCVNLVGSFECVCPPGLALDTDGLTCVADSCFGRDHPELCEHICTSIPGGDYVCSCQDGYELSEDMHNCTEVNECDRNNGGCQYDCINFEGGFECACPEGMFLHTDGKSCVIQCYTCENVGSNEECTDLVTCPPSETACFATMRTRGSELLITKGCKQDLACVNNLIQNPRDQGEGPSQCNLNGIHSKCECCCFTTECNADLCPYPNELPTCPSFVVENVVFRGVDLDGSILPGGVAALVCPEGFEPSFGDAGVTKLNCVYDMLNGTSAWDGSSEDFDVCVDIDECAVDNGGCVAPASCVNYPGGFECVCPDFPEDYVLVDGTICERDECADIDQGGCSHNCTNTIGGYMCYCPGELSLVTDGLTCDIDECRENNGGCVEICINTLGGNECGCHNAGYAVGEDGVSCEDVDECLTDNGGCSDVCVNTDGSFECSCSEGRIMNEDGLTCRDDPCFPDNGGCEQLCIVDGDNTICACESGFTLNDDGTCTDIDECAPGVNTCSYNCTNTIGGFQCNCPPGTALDHDGITCGFACFSCHGAATNEECNAGPMEVCRPDSMACENEVRVHHGKKQIFKRCKQEHACRNNQIQNPRQAFLPTQCNGDEENDVCRCCCTSHLCNEAERVCSKRCNINKADLAIIMDSSSSVKVKNFNTMRSFVQNLVNAFQVGVGMVHVALIRYNKNVDVRRTFADSQNANAVMDDVRQVPYRGSGTRTGQAIQYALENIFKTGNGMRGDAPQILVTITDGKSQDDVLAPSEAIRAAGISTYAVGIGTTIDRSEVVKISGAEERAFTTASFAALETTVLENIRVSLCQNKDECLVDNGGCSHTCTDTDGSYMCSCPEDFVLSGDLRTCVSIAENPDQVDNVDECAEDNGGCTHTCLDNEESYECLCPDNMYLEADNKTCASIDDCASSPCEQQCIDTASGFFCECGAGFALNADGSTCSARTTSVGCGAGFAPLGQTCVAVVDVATSFADAAAACTGMGARLMAVNDLGTAILVGRVAAGAWVGSSSELEAGVFVNSDGNVNALDNWADGSPGDFNKCVYVDANGKFNTDNCLFRRQAVCEKARSGGEIVFLSTWPNGAQARTSWVTGSPFLKVSMPTMIKSVSSWFCTVVRNEGSAVIFSQSDLERVSGNGYCEFVFEGKEQVPVGSCSVEALQDSDDNFYDNYDE